MLTLKQDRCPVFLLTMGEHSQSLNAPTYPLYKEPRTWGVKNGIGAAVSGGLDGLARKLLRGKDGERDGPTIFFYRSKPKILSLGDF